VRFRGTLSSDFRAPNMNNLYEPIGVTSTGFFDRLTNVNNSGQRLYTGGNPDLTPETAKTVTAGLVFTPSFIDRFSFAVDFYQTHLTNAITQISYQSDTIQGLCLASAPQYNSPFCTLAIRPITNVNDPNYTQPVNAPTAIRNAPANSSLIKTRGFDFQIDYNMDLWGGQFSFRHLANYQPTNSTLNTPASTFYTWAVQPHLMQTTFINWSNSAWNLALQNRWLSNVSLKTSDNSLNPANNQHYEDASLDAYDVVDVTVGKNFEFGDSNVEAFLTVSNLLNERAPLSPDASGLPGLFYPTQPFYDDMGRYFTLGFRSKF
jgi:outer membrane receptor protein involved in Fe transport